jgi:hypothetical protein
MSIGVSSIPGMQHDGIIKRNWNTSIYCILGMNHDGFNQKELQMQA